MTPRWMSQLVRARESQENSATQRLAFARKAHARAHDTARAEAARIEAMSAVQAESDAGAFVAAAVALQAAAATHAAAVGEAHQADNWMSERQRQLTEALVARHSAEKLRDNAQIADLLIAARLARRELDEAAAVAHERRRRGDDS